MLFIILENILSARTSSDFDTTYDHVTHSSRLCARHFPDKGDLFIKCLGRVRYITYAILTIYL